MAAYQSTRSTGPASKLLVVVQAQPGLVPLGGFWMQEGLVPPESDFQACWVVSASSMKKEREMAKVTVPGVVLLTFLTKEPRGMVTMPVGAQRSLSVPSAAEAQ